MASIDIPEIEIRDYAVGNIKYASLALIKACRKWVENNPVEPLPGTIVTWQDGSEECVAIRNKYGWLIADEKRDDCTPYHWSEIIRYSNGEYHIVRT